MIDQIERLLARRWARAGLLLGLTLLAAGLRFYKLGEWSFWIDEVITLQRAKAAVNDSISILPLSTFLIGLCLDIWGASELSARLVPAIIGTLSIPILYFPVRRLWGEKVGLLFAIFLAVSPWHIFWSQNARFYTALLLLYALALLAFAGSLVVQGKTRLLLLFAFVVLSALAAAERPVAYFLVIIVAVYLVVQAVVLNRGRSRLEHRWTRRMLLIAAGVPVVLFLVANIIQLAQGQEATIVSYSRTFVGQTNTTPFQLLASLTVSLGLPTITLGAVSSARWLTRRDSLGLLLILSAIVPPAVLVIISPFVFAVDRYAFVALPSWLLLAAIAIDEGITEKRAYASALALGFFSLLILDGITSDALYFTRENGGREDWKRAFAVVQAQRGPQDLVFSNRPIIGEFYLGQQVLNVNTMNPTLLEAPTSRSWFVIGTRTSGPISPRVSEWIERNTVLVEVADVNTRGRTLNMRLYRYDPANHAP